jgi:hypothetical protein
MEMKQGFLLDWNFDEACEWNANVCLRSLKDFRALVQYTLTGFCVGLLEHRPFQNGSVVENFAVSLW